MEGSRIKYIKRIDWFTVILTIGMAIFGIVCIASATSAGYEEGEPVMEYIGSLLTGNTLKQLLFLVLSLVISVALMFLNYTNIKEFIRYIYIGMVAILAIVLIMGSRQRGMKGWFYFSALGVGIQPAEICKLFAIIVFAYEFSKVTEGRDIGITRFRELLSSVWKLAILVALIVMQPDFGTAVVYIMIYLSLFFMSKTSMKIIFTILGTGILSLPLLWFLLSPEQKNRVYVFIDPTLDPEGSGFNVLRAKSVSSAGGALGKGLFSPDLLTQKSNYLPEKHTDFIFSSTCEAIGFYGALIFVILYLILIIRLFMLSMRAKDDFGSYIIMGVAFMLLFHFIENVGMNIGIMPVTGIPLPFVSYGGSNLLTSVIGVALAVNVDMRRARNNRLRDDIILSDRCSCGQYSLIRLFLHKNNSK